MSSKEAVGNGKDFLQNDKEELKLSMSCDKSPIGSPEVRKISTRPKKSTMSNTMERYLNDQLQWATQSKPPTTFGLSNANQVFNRSSKVSAFPGHM